MPRTGGVYSAPAGTKGTPNTTILSAPYNTFVDDLVSDANAARPITAGGTDATTAAGARANLGVIDPVADRTALKALDTTKVTVAFLKEAGREGVFKWTTGDFSTQITADTQEGIYVKADAIAATSGAWVRFYDSAVVPTWFGATGDGTTSDQTAVAAAVTSAFDAGDDMYWPDGTYLTTASISNFHGVRHLGPGVVKRGSDLFYVEPKEGVTNILYVATTGANTNDGLSSSQPFATVQAAGDVIYGYPWADSTWKVQYAAGTFVEAATFNRPFPSANRVQFLGAAVADGTTPTTIMDSPSGASKVGLFFQNGVRAHVEDIKFTDYADTGVPSASGGSTGITADNFCDLYARNVYATNCDTAIEAAAETRLRVQAGVLDANGVGVRCISHVTYTIGYGGSAADITGATGTAILNSTVAGLTVQESATGHADYVYFGSNVIGIDANEKSRTHAMGCNFQSNGTNARVRSLATIYDNPTTPNTWGAGTSSDRIYRSNSLEVNKYQDAAALIPGVLRNTSIVSTTSSSATATTVYTFAARELAERNSGFRLQLWGDVVGVSGTKTVAVKLGGVTIITKTIAAASTDWRVEVEFANRTAANDQRTCCVVLENGASPTVDTAGFTTIDLTASQALTFEIASNGTDTMRCRMQNLDLILG